MKEVRSDDHLNLARVEAHTLENVGREGAGELSGAIALPVSSYKQSAGAHSFKIWISNIKGFDIKL